MDRIEGFIESKLAESIEELKALCAFASVAVAGKHMTETADFVASLLEGAGLKTRMLSVPGSNPVVFGEMKGRSDKTLLFYNHYDVQPPEPLNQWKTDPFSLTEKNGCLFGRGAADNKGNIIARLLALKAWKAVNGELPVTVRFFIEGEEEIGSPNLGPVVKAHGESLRSDGCLWEGGSKDVEDRPTLYFGAKGLCYLELEAKGLEKELHSSMGAIIPNPAWRLIWALNALRSAEDKITIDGFYDDVSEPGEAEFEAAEALSAMGDRLKESLGMERFVKSLEGAEMSREHFFGPSFTICGLEAGYTGPGPKMVLPKKAIAKIDFCLVPRQKAADIAAKVQQHLAKAGFDDIVVTVHADTVDPGATPLNHPFSRIMRSAAEKTYGLKPTLFPLMPSPGPYSWFRNFLGIPTVSIGVGHFQSNIHAPNENIRISDFTQGARFVATMLSEFSK